MIGSLDFRHLRPIAALAVFGLLTMPAFASSDDAWKELWQKSEAACLKASKLRQAKSNVVLDFEASVMRVVTGRYPQPHMQNAAATMYCLYDKKTGKTEIAEPSAPLNDESSMFGYPILTTLLLGLLAGWLATKIVGGTGGIIRNLVIGLVGALVGHWIFGRFGIWVGGPLITSFLAAVFGGVIVIGVSRFLGR